MIKSGIRWGDYDETEDEIVIDQKDQDNPNVRYETRISYHLNEKGQKVKRTELVRVEMTEVLVPKAVIERQKRMCANKFGTAATCDPKDNMASVDEEIVVIMKTRGGATKKKEEAPAKKTMKTLADFREWFIEDMIANGYSPTCARKTLEQYMKDHPELTEKTTQGQVGIACRTCGGPHWTGQCPNKGSNPSVGDTSGTSGTTGTADTDSNSGGKYRPPARVGQDGKGGDSDHEYKIRINNLTEEATEQDLFDLAEPIGPVARVNIIKDRYTGVPRGFAFVTFRNKETVSKAINELNGHRYYHLILQVEMAKARET